MATKLGLTPKKAIEWINKKLERDLEFLERMNNYLDIEDVVEKCKNAYKNFLSLKNGEAGI